MKIKTILGLISMIVGVFVAIYVGVWWAFVGGIIQTIDAIKLVPIDSKEIAIGICRIVFATSIGEGVAILFFFLGASLIGWNFIGRRKQKKFK